MSKRVNGLLVWIPVLPGVLAVGGLSTGIIGILKPLCNCIAEPTAPLYTYTLVDIANE